MSKTVVVTGASGFIGKAIVKELLAAGYAVRGSVRSDAKAEETRQAVGPDGLDRLSFVHLDLTSDDGWDGALEGADALLHTASPFPLETPKDPEELIRPAVDGTLRAMRAAAAAGVERVVLTSSCVAIYGDELAPGQTAFDESNWSPTDSGAAYDLSKTLAEKAAWDFVRDEAPQIGLSTVNPGVVLGVPTDDNYGTSLGLVERLLDGQDPMLPRLQMPVVDVDDVATMHVKSLEVDAAVGERFAAAAGAMWFEEMAQVLNDNIEGSKAKTRVAPDWMLKLMARFMADLKTVVPRLGKPALVSGAKAERVLGIDFVTPEEAVLKSARYLRR
ncbi:MAG: SDR family NAD(P)-dependent oxidoreductase [Actinomycetota bacterium]